MESIELVRLFLAVAIGGCLLYFVVEAERPPERPVRDLEREHALGAHRTFRPAGCRQCKREG